MKRGIRPSVQAKSPLSCTNGSRGSGVSNPIALHLFSFVFNLHFLFFLSFFSLALFLLFFTLVTHRTRYARLCEPTSFNFWLPPPTQLCHGGTRSAMCRSGCASVLFEADTHRETSFNLPIKRSAMCKSGYTSVLFEAGTHRETGSAKPIRL